VAILGLMGDTFLSDETLLLGEMDLLRCVMQWSSMNGVYFAGRDVRTCWLMVNGYRMLRRFGNACKAALTTDYASAFGEAV
jgi:hypothetical protein